MVNVLWHFWLSSAAPSAMKPWLYLCASICYS